MSNTVDLIRHDQKTLSTIRTDRQNDTTREV